MSISVSGFVNKIRNMINYRTMTKAEIDADSHLTELYNEGWTTIRQRDNIDEASVKGLSANVKLLLPSHFSITLGHAYNSTNARTRTLNQKTQEYETTETPVDKSVKNVTNVQVAWSKSWKDYALNVNLSGHIQSRRFSSTYGYAPAYQQWDLNTRHTFNLKHCVIEPSLGLENIFNERDTSYWNSNFSTINPGRSLVFTVIVRSI